MYNTQKVKTTKGDWFGMIQNEKIKFGIEVSDDEIAKMSRFRFKSLVDKRVNSYALEYLKGIAGKHSKSTKILEETNKFKSLKRKDYLKENNLSKQDSQLLFKLRTRMLDVKSNFGEMYDHDLKCRTCTVDSAAENEDHLLVCDGLKSEVDENEEITFNSVFMDLENQKKAVKAFKAVLSKREVLFKYRENVLHL